MKTNKHLITSAFMAMITALFVIAGTSLTKADDHYDHHYTSHNVNSRQVFHEAWTHDSHGYWDNRASYHNYVSYHNHRGYWRPNSNGVMFFINIE